MDLDPQSSITRLFKSALYRVDGIALYISIIAVIVIAIFVALENIILGKHAHTDWLLPEMAIFVVLCLVLIYFNFAMRSKQNDNFDRIFNALFLICITVYFIIKTI